jgi:Smg protein
MFEVLEFVYDSYWSLAQCPTLPALHRKLNALGFRSGGVLNALVWLEDLQSAAHEQTDQIPREADDAGDACIEPLASSRLLTAAEHRKLGTQGWGLLTKLALAGSLPWNRMELVLDRAMATPGHTLDLNQLKLIMLMVFWSLDQPTEVVLAESLLDNSVAHAVH